MMWPDPKAGGKDRGCGEVGKDQGTNVWSSMRQKSDEEFPSQTNNCFGKLWEADV